MGGPRWGNDPSPQPLADGFEQSITQADSHADRLRRESDRVAKQATAMATLHKAGRKLEYLETEQTRLAQNAGLLHERWKQAWTGLVSDPSSPREMRGWLLLRKELIKQAADIQILRDEVKSLESKLTTHRQKLGQHLDELTAQRSYPDEPLASLRNRARRSSSAWPRSRPGAESRRVDVQAETATRLGANPALTLENAKRLARPMDDRAGSAVPDPDVTVEQAT